MIKQKEYARQLFRMIAIVSLTSFFSVTAGSQNQTVQMNESVKLGELFLLKKIMSDQYYLGCQSSNNDVACPVDKSGKIMLAFHMISMFSLDHSLTKEASDIFIKMIKGESKKSYWGYSRNSPPDLDDTSMAMQALFMLGIPQDSNLVSVFHKNPMNRYATFLNNTNTRLTAKPSVQNNMSIHPEINAMVFNMFHLLHEDKRINMTVLSNFQTKRGSWAGYFYPGDFYSTFLSMRLFCALLPSSSQTKQGLNFLVKSQNSDGSWGNPGNAYDTALALSTLLDCGLAKKTEKGIQYLLKNQNENGNWKTDNVIWSFIYKQYPYVVWKAYDEQHILTTALALSALKKYKNLAVNDRVFLRSNSGMKSG